MFDSQYRILYIEDDKVDQMAFKNMVKRRGLQYEYELASSVKEAIHKIEKEKYDLILIDYQLGDGSAFDVFPFIQGTPFIFATGEGDEEIAARALRAGASDYLIKDHERNYLTLLPYAIYTSINRSFNTKRLELLESVVVNAKDAIVVLEAKAEAPLELEAVYLNQAFEQMSGFQLKELMNRSWEILFSSENAQAILARTRAAFQRQEPLQIELFNQRKDGTHYWVEMNLVPILKEEDERLQFVLVQRDITDRKEAEQALIKARIEAEEARKREKQFLANISHEIRNPIQTVLNIVHLLRAGELDAKQEKYIGSLKVTAEFMVGLLSDLLEKAKIEAGEIQFEEIPFDLPLLLDKICNIYQYRAHEKGLVLNCDLDEAVPQMVIGDPTKLQQILSNLVSNAIKFTAKGEINCGLRVLSQSKTEVLINFSIRDTGIGIPAEKRQSIFDPYIQADSSTTRKFGGTGLGLSIVKHLVEGQGGKIWVESKEGQGSNFQISLSLKLAEKTPSAVPHSLQIDLSVLRSRKLLLVEDNPSNQMLISRLLAEYGLEVVMAKNGLKALSMLAQEAVELVLTDINMPDMGGDELIASMRNHAQEAIRDLPVLVFSGATDNDLKKRLQDFKVNGFLNKPIQPEVLIEAIAHVFESAAFAKPKKQSQPDECLDLGPLFRVSRQGSKFVRDMIQIFLELTPRAISQMKEALRNQNWLDLQKTSHFIKSTFNTTGNQELFQLAHEVEEIAKNRPEYALLQNKLNRIEEICLNLAPRLQNFLKTEMTPEAALKV
ncbi:MAG: response regulator [Bacteroidota bacterium]